MGPCTSRRKHRPQSSWLRPICFHKPRTETVCILVYTPYFGIHTLSWYTHSILVYTLYFGIHTLYWYINSIWYNDSIWYIHFIWSTQFKLVYTTQFGINLSIWKSTFIGKQFSCNTLNLVEIVFGLNSTFLRNYYWWISLVLVLKFSSGRTIIRVLQ